MSTSQAPRDSLLTLVRRGACKRCPACGIGRLYDQWHDLREECAHCGLLFEPGAGDTWFFMYMTTGGITGVLIVLMLLVRPENLWLGRIVVLVCAIVTLFVTLPHRKGIAVALDYAMARALGELDERRGKPGA